MIKDVRKKEMERKNPKAEEWLDRLSSI
jgi:hypothetical protein